MQGVIASIKEVVDREGNVKEGSERLRFEYFEKMKNAVLLGYDKMTIANYLNNTDVPISDLCVVAKTEEMPIEIIRSLRQKEEEAKLYEEPFDLDKFLSTMAFLDSEKREVRPTEMDVVEAFEYLNSKDEVICAYTVKETIRKSVQGKLDVKGHIKVKKNDSK